MHLPYTIVNIGNLQKVAIVRLDVNKIQVSL
jgi:hypothetical protein